MDLATMADKYLWDEPGVVLGDLGPGAQAVHESLALEGYTMPFLATLFWRCYLESTAFTLNMHMLKASRAAMREKETYVIRHGQGGSRYDLVVLDPDFTADEPVARQIKPSRVDIRDGWRKVSRSGSMEWSAPWGAIDLNWAPDAVDELMRVHEVGVIIAPKPTVVATGVASPAWRVETDMDQVGTAGPLTRDADGRLGVPVAAHTVSRASEIRVDGRAGTVTHRDEVTDTAFVHIPDAPLPRRRVGMRGPLTRVAPSEGDTVRFDGAASGPTETTLVGWQPTILTPESSLRNNRCLTTPDTEAGDSGASLVDVHDHILGFAINRSVPGAVSEYSSWVWAHHVFRIHKLKLVG